jgi:hypothetical protein
MREGVDAEVLSYYLVGLSRRQVEGDRGEAQVGYHAVVLVFHLEVPCDRVASRVLGADGERYVADLSEYRSCAQRRLQDVKDGEDVTRDREVDERQLRRLVDQVVVYRRDAKARVVQDLKHWTDLG